MPRYGRILNPNKDALFSYPPPGLCSVSAGGVFLTRDIDDDYARFRVPDTGCPPLPGPAEPKDSGIAEEAEPNRWLVVNGSPDTSDKWKLRAQEQAPGNDEIRLNYVVFSGDFLIEFRVEVLGGGGNYGFGNGHGIGVELWADSSNYIRAGAGRFWNGATVGMWRGLINGNPIFHEVAFVATGANVFIQLSRGNGSVSVRFSKDGITWTDWRVLGTLSGELRFGVRGFMVSLYGQPAGNAYADCKMHYVSTLSGAPTSVTVSTPVVDFTTPVGTQISWLPQVGTLEWRASNTPFSRDDAYPAWSNPSGEYRYWQARVTWSQQNYLLERIEILAPFMMMEFVMLRNRWIWQARTNANPITVPFFPIAASHRIADIRQVSGGYEVTFSEQVDEYWLLLQE